MKASAAEPAQRLPETSIGLMWRCGCTSCARPHEPAGTRRAPRDIQPMRSGKRSLLLAINVVAATLLLPIRVSRADDTATAEARPAPAVLPPLEPGLVRVPGPKPGRSLWVTGTIITSAFYVISVGLALEKAEDEKPGAWLAVPLAGPIIHVAAGQESEEGLRIAEITLAGAQLAGLGALIAGVIIASRAPAPPDEPLLVLGPSPLGLFAAGRF